MFHRCSRCRRRPVLIAIFVLLTVAMTMALLRHVISTLVNPPGRGTVDQVEPVRRYDEFVIDDRRRRYVSAMCFDSRRLGNLMFNYASLLGIARSNGMVAVMPRHGNWSLPNVFNLQVLRTSDGDDQYQSRDDHHQPRRGGHRVLLEAFSPFIERRPCAYDLETATLTDRHVMLHGFYQSWRYFAAIPRRELLDHFRFDHRVANAADRARVWRDLGRRTNTTTAPGSPRPRRPELVGVHVRRGDYVRSSSNVAYGYTIADENYFRRAMRYFVDRYPRVDFLVCSDEIAWARRYVALPEVPREVGRQVRVAYCGGGGDGEAEDVDGAAIDLAVLSRCDHVIMSTGTFGWWAAWLAGGTTIYYGGWPRSNSTLSAKVEKKDFFPPHWIPM